MVDFFVSVEEENKKRSKKKMRCLPQKRRSTELFLHVLASRRFLTDRQITDMTYTSFAEQDSCSLHLFVRKYFLCGHGLIRRLFLEAFVAAR